ncbi:hypothetical protein B0H14DRAFT_2467598 [Mycena olivaceomarginata]|nr:hypothetical protein B0H14DRAFT_2467598 [Mycena olivaceomarginata]
MPPTRGPLWEFFHRGRKRNTAHCNAYCLACIALYRPDNVPIPIDPRTCRSLLHRISRTTRMAKNFNGWQPRWGHQLPNFFLVYWRNSLVVQSSALSRRLHVLSRGKHCSWSCWLPSTQTKS